MYSLFTQENQIILRGDDFLHKPYHGGKADRKSILYEFIQIWLKCNF